jgi:hypothetical protein
MSTPKYNSKGQLIEELDTPTFIRAPFQSPKPVSPKRANIVQTHSDQSFVIETFATPPAENLAPPFATPSFATLPAENLAPPFLNAEEQEILAWCEAYQNLKKKGINIYKI